MNMRTIIVGLLASTVLSACSVERQVSQNVDIATQAATDGVASAAAPTAPADVSPIKIRDAVYVGSKAVRNENGDPLPARLERSNGVTLVRTTPVSLKEISAAITEITKIPVVVAANVPAPMASAPASSVGSAGGSSAPPPMSSGPVPADFPLNQALAALEPGTAQPTSVGSYGPLPSSTAEELSLKYTGKLSGLLDAVAAHFNVSWRYEGGRITFSYVLTRSFDVPALPIIANLSFDLSSKSESSSDQGASATSGQEASTKSGTDVWREMQVGLQSLVGSGSLAVNTTTGVVTVTADPGTVNRVAEYIRGMNDRLAQQVAISVKVYSVTLSDDEEFNLDVAGIFADAGKYGINIGNSVASGGVVPPVGGVAGGGLGWALLDTKSKWYGSNALVDALSRRGDVSVVTTASVTTVNGVPVPLQVGTLRDYVRSVKTTLSGDTNAVETEIEPGSVTTGFNLHLVPRVDRNGDLLLQYGINISELTGSEDGFETFTTNDTTVQLRRMNQRNFIQQARIPNGDTLVLAGFEQVRSASERRGVGHYNFPFLGGGRKSEVQREIIVIAITPTLLDLKTGN